MPTILSLFDESGAMVKPWTDAGYDAIIVDMQHPAGVTRIDERTIAIGANIRDIIFTLEGLGDIVFVTAFPPCTDLAVSGARWFKAKAAKNHQFQFEAMELVYIAKHIANHHNVPYMIENPVSRISTLWRKPDFIFQPYEYSGLCSDDNYTKKTCLWTGNGFAMPVPNYDPSIEVDDRIHKMGPSPERAKMRSKTPMGFARAVFEANALL